MSRAPEAERLDREVLGLLGLARRAGGAIVGPHALERVARAGRLAALVVAGDATPNARRRLAGLTGRTTIPTVVLADRARLGDAVGKGVAVAVGLTDRRLAERVVAAASRTRTGDADAGPAGAWGVGSRVEDRTFEEDRR